MYIVVFPNGKKGISRREMEKERHELEEQRWIQNTQFNSSHADIVKQEKKHIWVEGEELKRRVVQSWNLNSCQTIVRVAAVPAAVLLIFPTTHSTSTSVLIPPLLSSDDDLTTKTETAPFGHRKSAHTLTQGYLYVQTSCDRLICREIWKCAERDNQGGNNTKLVHAQWGGGERRGR